MSVFDNVDKMWFGTKERMGWVETPQSGANVSPTGMTAEADLLNGGAYVRNSWGSHKNYEFSWGDAADRQLASLLHGYANGTYGRGLIYFQDPMFFETNILPRHWADPSMAVSYEAPDLTGGLIQPTYTPTPPNSHNLPANTAIYGFGNNVGYDGFVNGDAIYIPVPEGMDLIVGAYYTGTGGAKVVARKDGATEYVLTEHAVGDPTNMTTIVRGAGYVEIALRDGAGGTLVIAGITARLRVASTSDLLIPVGGELGDGTWYSGEGNTGCRFVGKPTLYSNTGIGGGQVGLACTLREVGAWQ